MRLNTNSLIACCPFDQYDQIQGYENETFMLFQVRDANRIRTGGGKKIISQSSRVEVSTVILHREAKSCPFRSISEKNMDRNQ